MAAWGWAGELTGNRTLICLTYKLKPEPCGGYATQEQIPPKHCRGLVGVPRCTNYDGLVGCTLN